jgi:hypothetical protein
VNGSALFSFIPYTSVYHFYHHNEQKEKNQYRTKTTDEKYELNNEIVLREHIIIHPEIPTSKQDYEENNGEDD